jgi:hypothetical protein
MKGAGLNARITVAAIAFMEAADHCHCSLHVTDCRGSPLSRFRLRSCPQESKSTYYPGESIHEVKQWRRGENFSVLPQQP